MTYCVTIVCTVIISDQSNYRGVICRPNRLTIPKTCTDIHVGVHNRASIDYRHNAYVVAQS